MSGIAGRWWAAALVLGLATSAQAQAPVDVSVRKVELASQAGQRASLKLYLAKTGAGQSQESVKVFWVDGNRRTEIYEGNARFAAGRDGFLNQINVNLPAGNLANGHLEVVASAPARDNNFANNKGELRLGGGDLFFEGGIKIVQRAGATPNREVVITVKNRGPAAIPAGCRIELQLAEQGPARTINVNLPAMAVNRVHEIKQRYNYRQSGNNQHNAVKARVRCEQDRISNNDFLQGPLR